jgi:hypothetical protein
MKEKKAGLNMTFGEALQRFAHTDPAELPDAKPLPRIKSKAKKRKNSIKNKGLDASRA